MESISELEDTINFLAGYVNRIDDTVEEEIEGTTTDERPVLGLQCTHGSHLYVIIGALHDEFFSIRYPLSIDHNIAYRFSASDDQISERDVQEARAFLDEKLDDVDEDLRREIRVNLIQMLTAGHSAPSLDTTKSLNIHGFDISTKIFPNAPSFDVWEFEKSVQCTINLGWVGKDYLGMAYGLKDEGGNVEQEQTQRNDDDIEFG